MSNAAVHRLVVARRDGSTTDPRLNGNFVMTQLAFVCARRYSCTEMQKRDQEESISIWRLVPVGLSVASTSKRQNNSPSASNEENTLQIPTK
ncbi:unnamed protein product [Protopolystoma xenopodis]|uniref:Uncharacterized protein n=1 Tax=Protopolystoma xenopodis TaxID=117903 RepID=A0A3S5B6V0_9PLAT|nr:unnamed protein product [Protopolystoma xenopodis]